MAAIRSAQQALRTTNRIAAAASQIPTQINAARGSEADDATEAPQSCNTSRAEDIKVTGSKGGSTGGSIIAVGSNYGTIYGVPGPPNTFSQHAPVQKTQDDPVKIDIQRTAEKISPARILDYAQVQESRIWEKVKKYLEGQNGKWKSLLGFLEMLAAAGGCIIKGLQFFELQEKWTSLLPPSVDLPLTCLSIGVSFVLACISRYHKTQTDDKLGKYMKSVEYLLEVLSDILPESPVRKEFTLKAFELHCQTKTSTEQKYRYLKLIVGGLCIICGIVRAKCVDIKQIFGLATEKILLLCHIANFLYSLVTWILSFFDYVLTDAKEVEELLCEFLRLRQYGMIPNG